MLSCCYGNIDQLAKTPARHASWLLHGISLINRGITQIATTPLAWVKIILRGIITCFNHEKTNAEESISLKDFAKKGHQIIDKIEKVDAEYKKKEEHKNKTAAYNKQNLEAVINTLYVKFKKKVENNPTNIKNIDEVYKNRYGKMKDDYFLPENLNIKQIKKARAIFNLFAPQEKQQQQEQIASKPQTRATSNL